MGKRYCALRVTGYSLTNVQKLIRTDYKSARMGVGEWHANGLFYRFFAHDYRELSHGYREIAHDFREIAHDFREIAHDFREIAHGYREIAHDYREIAHGYREIAHGHGTDPCIFFLHFGSMTTG